MSSVRYLIVHETRYDYGSPVSLSHQQLHLAPRPHACLQVSDWQLSIEPQPSWRQDALDAFGNPVTWLGFDTPHARLHLRSTLQLSLRSQARPTRLLSRSIGWETLRDRLAYGAGKPRPEDLRASRFLFESPHVRVKHELASYAQDCFPPGRPVLLGAQALMAKIHREFTFDPEATSVATPVMDLLQHKRGVCQDFAHLMIACLRALGLAARYVSGYLLTRPPPGKPRLIGADASHAWVSVYAPDSRERWIDFDPTNNLLPNTEHIPLAYGRDFSDISPLRGIILGGSRSEPEVAVTVVPVDEEGVPEALDPTPTPVATSES